MTPLCAYCGGPGVCLHTETETRLCVQCAMKVPGILKNPPNPLRAMNYPKRTVASLLKEKVHSSRNPTRRIVGTPRIDATFESQGGVCYYCQRTVVRAKWSIDHKLPTCRGGRNNWGNIVGCCMSCNNAKGPLTEEEFRACSSMSEVKAALTRVSIQLQQPVAPKQGLVTVPI